MKRITFTILFSLFFSLAWVNLLQAQTDSTLVSKWGITPTRHGSGWKLTVNAKGDSANHHGAGLKSGTWEGIRGAFPKPIVGNTSANGAIVVTGKITFVGQGPDQWSGIRYGLYNNLAPGSLIYAGTDSAAWGTLSGSTFAGMPETSYGYTFMPQSGTSYVGNIPNGFSGSQGIALNASWISSYAGPGFGGGVIQQAPARAVMSAGTYSFAFSTHSITDSTKRINFYLTKDGTPTAYWYGGSYIVMDTAGMKRTDTLNAVCFGVESSTAMTNMILTNVHVSLGADIIVPAAPFQAFYLDQWGMFGRTGGWKFKVDADTIIGNAGIGGTKVPTGSWATIRGGFTVPVTATQSKAIIVKGDIEFVGSGPVTWSGLRYGLFNIDSASTVQYALTDTANWGSIQNKGTDSAKFVAGKENAHGFMFAPQSGTNYVGNIPSGFNASQGAITGGGWISTFSGPGLGGLIQQAPARANFTAGKYKFAFSVQPLANGTNEVRFYMYKDATPVTYWYGGTLIDTTKQTPTFNSVCFGLNPNYDQTTSPISAMLLKNVQVDLGTPISVPAAPFQAFYLDQWGMFGRTGGWKFKVDPDSIIGNAGIGGSKIPTGSWATIRGGFTVPVTATQSKAVIVKGDVEFVGSGPVTWSGLRYGLFNIDSASTVQYARTDSANWGNIPTKGADSAKFVAGKENAHGFMFAPQSGTNYVGNIPSGFNASQGAITGGGWISTFSGPGLGGLIQQAPARATFSAGKYKFAFSVQPLADGTNEVRFYMYKDVTPVTYWYGGTLIDTTKQIPTFNSVCFGLNPNYDQTTSPISALKLTNVMVDLGTPITVPAAPFQAFYLDQWGMFGRTGGWKFKVDPDSIIGNAGIGGSKVPTGSWATIRGGFTVPVTATQAKAVIVKGDIKFVGSGPVTWSGLRYGLFNIDSASSVQYARTDTANWGNIPTKGADSAKFVAGKENAHGFMFTPQSGTGYVGNIPSGFNGSQGAITGGSWISTFGGPGLGGLIQQAPARANFNAGSYKFAISVQPLANGTNEVRFYMVKDSSVVTYWYGGTLIDTTKLKPTFNSVCFGLNPNYDQTTSPISAMILQNVQVDLGNPIAVPAAPWQNYYVGDWGFYQDKMGGWTFNPDIIGNAGISGKKPLTGLAELRGGFSGVVTPRNGKDSCLVIKGDLELIGGGFQKAGSFRFGLFNNPTPGSVKVKVDTVAGVVIDSTRWLGSATAESGYLIIPNSGTNVPVSWGTTTGTFGGIINGLWNSTTGGYVLANNLQIPANAVASAGKYSFTISVAPTGTGTQQINYQFVKSDKSYTMQGSVTDNHSPLPATGFNGIVFALDTGNVTTSMQLTNVQVTMGKPVVVSVQNNEGALLPTVYSLSQNYPNPFNPTTTINFALPKSGKVTLTVYDLLGRQVKTLVNGDLQAGYHKVEFNANNLASGVYFYRIEAGDFSNVKKLMLLK